MNRVVSFFVFSFATASLLAQENEPPTVSKLSPENGAKAVSTAITELSVTFDQDMDTGGFSFVGGGPAFPKVTGKPFWKSKRECVLPVALEPNKEYTYQLNSDRFQNFKSATGVILKPLAVKFKTAARVDPNAKPATPTDRLKTAIERHYSYLEIRKADWPALWKEFEPKLDAAKTPKQFATLAGKMLAKTGDPHIWLKVNQEVIPAFRRNVAPNADYDSLPDLIDGWKRHNKFVAIGKIDPDITYVALLSFQAKNADDFGPAFDAIKSAAGSGGSLVIDLRFNAGGNELIGREIAGCFVDAPKLYAKHADPNVQERWLQPTANGPKFRGKIAVLTGPYVLSSAEGFLLMMKQVENATLIGETSFGSSGNPQPHDLGNGVTVMLPSWKAMLPDGEIFEGKGIKPDVEVKMEPDDFSKRLDPVLKRAIEFLKK